jgi:hypothetical protein
MAEARTAEYVLTVVQHTYCSDCIWLKGKITDVYHASGIVRGEDSKHWRMHIISPPWDRNQRATDFPNGFTSVDVPALKLEVDRRVMLATQDPGLISEMLIKLKTLLMSDLGNAQIYAQLQGIAAKWKNSPDKAVCVVSST